MAFKVHFSGQAQPQEFGDEDGYEFLAGGVLAVHFGDGQTWAQFHPPTKWEQVSADPDHPAGLNTPYVAEEDEDYGDEYEDEDEYEDGDFEDGEAYEDGEADEADEA